VPNITRWMGDDPQALREYLQRGHGFDTRKVNSSQEACSYGGPHFATFVLTLPELAQATRRGRGNT